MLRISVALIACGLLSACGGGGGGGGSGGGPNTYTIGGTVTGLTGGGLVLQNNAGNNLNVVSGGSFTFSTALAGGAAYSVTVATQPTNPSQTCTVASGAGSVASANVTNVQITCTTNTYPVGGTVSGLQGTGLVLQNNGGDDLAVTANGPITFATNVVSGTTYDVTVAAQPTSAPALTCTVASGTGTVTSGPVTNVAVTCSVMTGKFLYLTNYNSLTVSGFAIDKDTGDLTPVPGSPFATVGDLPTVPFADPSGKYLYVIGDDSVPFVPGPATLTGFAIDATTGALTPIPGLPVDLDATPALVRFHPNGEFLYVFASEGTANANNGLHVYAIDAATGELDEIAGSPYENDGDPFRGGMFDPSGEFLYLPVGAPAVPPANDIAVYAVDAVTGSLTARPSRALDKHVNQLVVHPSGDFVFTRNSDGTLSILPIDSAGLLETPVTVGSARGLGMVFAAGGELVYIIDGNPVLPPPQPPLPPAGLSSLIGYRFDAAAVSLTPLPNLPYMTGGSNASALVRDPTDRYVAVTNFEFGIGVARTIAVFAIDDADGSLVPLPGSPYSVPMPGGVVYDPSGLYAYVGELPTQVGGPGAVSAYEIDVTTGEPIIVDSEQSGNGTTGFIAIVGLQ